MQCGPAHLAAIKKGHIYIGYDTGFVFAEVNADRVEWIVKQEGNYKYITGYVREFRLLTAEDFPLQTFSYNRKLLLVRFLSSAIKASVVTKRGQLASIFQQNQLVHIKD